MAQKKARHAFGSLENVDTAIANSLVDSYDILLLKDADGKAYIGWVDKNGNKVIVDNSSTTTIVEGDSLPETGETGKIYIFEEEAYVYNGTEYISISKSADLTALENQIATKVDEAKVKELIADYAESDVDEVVEF